MKWTPEEVKGKTPEQLVKMQMEDWLFDDPALMASYDPEKVADCLEWVAKKVRMNAEHAGVAVCCHEEVFRMARDYFVDGHARMEKEIQDQAIKAEQAGPKPRKRKKEKVYTVEKVAAEAAPHPADPTAKPAEDTDLFAEEVR